MALRQRKKQLIPERLHPGDPEPDWCSPGSIEQELDMCENGELRGDEILHHQGLDPRRYTGNPVELDRLINTTWEADLAENDREGDEMTGDEHSSGLAGGEPELQSQINTSTGLPGDRTRIEEQEMRLQGFPEVEDVIAPQAPPTIINLNSKRKRKKSKSRS